PSAAYGDAASFSPSTWGQLSCGQAANLVRRGTTNPPQSLRLYYPGAALLFELRNTTLHDPLWKKKKRQYFRQVRKVSDAKPQQYKAATLRTRAGATIGFQIDDVW